MEMNYDEKNYLFIKWQIARSKGLDFADKLWFNDWLKFKNLIIKRQ